MIADTLQYGNGPCIPEQFAGCRRRNAVGGGQHPPVEVKPDDGRHELGVDHEERGVRSGQIPGEFVVPTGQAEQPPHRVWRGQQPADHHGALGDHQTPPAGSIRPPIGAGQVAEVGQARIVGVVDPDGCAHRPIFPGRNGSVCTGHAVVAATMPAARPARSRPTGVVTDLTKCDGHHIIGGNVSRLATALLTSQPGVNRESLLTSPGRGERDAHHRHGATTDLIGAAPEFRGPARPFARRNDSLARFSRELPSSSPFELPGRAHQRRHRT